MHLGKCGALGEQLHVLSSLKLKKTSVKYEDIIYSWWLGLGSISSFNCTVF